MKITINSLKKGLIGGLAKLIMLTFFACCVTITFVGCENGNKNIDKNKLASGKVDTVRLLEESSEIANMYFSGEQGEIERADLLEKQDGIESRRKNKRPKRRSL